jgi:hypothetical protein
VTLLPDNAVSVHHGSGRAKIPMLTSTTGGHVSVIPADARVRAYPHRNPLSKAGRDHRPGWHQLKGRPLRFTIESHIADVSHLSTLFLPFA